MNFSFLATLQYTKSIITPKGDGYLSEIFNRKRKFEEFHHDSLIFPVHLIRNLKASLEVSSRNSSRFSITARLINDIVENT